MTLNDLKILLEYHYWARDRVLDAAEALSAEQFTKDLGSSFKSVRDTLVHIYVAEWAWYSRWMGNSPKAALPFEMFPNVGTLRRAWTEHEGKVRAYVDGLGEAGLNRVIEYRLLSGQPGKSAIWQMVQHVVNHATYHRGQVSTMLRQLGAQPARSMDLDDFYRERSGDGSRGMIRRAEAPDFGALLAVINDGASAYRGVIAADRWKDPYMPAAELEEEIAAGVVFWGCEENGDLVAVMGLQDVADVTLIRHAYTLASHQGRGLGSALLTHLRGQTTRPILIGTWKAATWAIRFYERHGFRLVSEAEKRALLQRYWTVPERQIEESVVLADARWAPAR